MRVILFLVCISMVPLMGWSQPCGDPSGIFLLSQDDVDNFQTNYGPCDSVVGTLYVGTYDAATNITDLTPLNGINWVNWLWVIDNHELTTLNGLQNIKRNNAGKLNVQHNDKLIDMTALRGFGPGVGQMAITNCPVLTNLDGLDSITSSGTSIVIRSNAILTDISALSRVTSIARIFELTDCPMLTDISALSNFKDFAEDLPPNSTNGARFFLYENTLLRDCSPICHVLKEDLGRLRTINSLQFDSIDNNYLECFDEAAMERFGLCCPDEMADTLLLDNTPIPKGIYASKKLISSMGSVQSGDTIYARSNNIDLKPSFQVQLGAVLELLKGNCNN